MSNGSHAYQISEHPWESRTLPRRPTRLVAVPPANRGHRHADPRRLPWKRTLRAVVRGLRDAGESLAFLALLASLLGGLWAMARIL